MTYCISRLSWFHCAFWWATTSTLAASLAVGVVGSLVKAAGRARVFYFYLYFIYLYVQFIVLRSKIYVTHSTGCMVWGMCLHTSSYCPILAGTLAVCISGCGLGCVKGGFVLHLLKVGHAVLLTFIFIDYHCVVSYLLNLVPRFISSQLQ